MNVPNSPTSPISTEAHAPDDAVGMEKWFVAIVRHNTEKSVCDSLISQGINAYVASQPRLRIYPSGRKKWIHAVIISSKVFIRCSEKQRLAIVRNPLIYRFLTNPGGALVNGHRPLAVIPDAEMDTLRFMLGQSDFPVSFDASQYPPGAAVAVVRGSLKGLRGEVIETDSVHKEIIIRLDLLGCAKVQIPASDLSPLP